MDGWLKYEHVPSREPRENDAGEAIASLILLAFGAGIYFGWKPLTGYLGSLVVPEWVIYLLIGLVFPAVSVLIFWLREWRREYYGNLELLAAMCGVLFTLFHYQEDGGKAVVVLAASFLGFVRGFDSRKEGRKKRQAEHLRAGIRAVLTGAFQVKLTATEAAALDAITEPKLLEAILSQLDHGKEWAKYATTATTTADPPPRWPSGRTLKAQERAEYNVTASNLATHLASVQTEALRRVMPTRSHEEIERVRLLWAPVSSDTTV